MASKHAIANYIRENLKEIQWHECDGGGFIATVNRVSVRINGGEMSPMMLTIIADNESFSIREPLPFAAAPAGRFVAFFKEVILRKPYQSPEPEVQADLALRDMLKEILDFATKQVMERFQQVNYEKKLRDRIWYKLTNRQ